MFSLQKISVSVFAFLLPFSLSPAGISKQYGARESAMAGLSLYSTGSWPGIENPAGLSFCRSRIASFSYSNRFMINGLGTGSAVIAVPAGRPVFAASWSRFGNSNFCRHNASFLSGMPLSESIHAGISIDFVTERCSGDYDPWNKVTFGAGIIVKTGKNGFTSVNIFNPFSSPSAKGNIPSALRVEYSGDLNSQFRAGAGLEMKRGSKLSVLTGCEYRHPAGLFLRGGYSTLYRSFSAGLGYEAGKIRMDVAFSSHERLGISSNCSIVFRFKENNHRDH